MYTPINSETRIKLEALEYHVDNLQRDNVDTLEKFEQLWYFIVATIVFTFIGIISVLTWTIA